MNLLTLRDIVIILVASFLLSGVLGCIRYPKDDDLRKSIRFGLISFFIALIVLALGFILYNTNTQTGQRKLKEWKSEIDGGLYREIIITSEEGREIFRYEGKIDIELNKNNTNNSNYILFESEEGLRYIIYYGIQDTVLIIEKPQK